MIGAFLRQSLSVAMSFLLVVMAAAPEAGAQQPAQPPPTGYSGQGVPLSAAELQQLAAPSRPVSGRPGCPDFRRGDLSRPGCRREQLAGAKQEPHRNSSHAGRRYATVGTQCKGALTVPLGPRQPGEKPHLDFLAGRGVFHPVRRSDVGSSDVARPGKSCRQFEIRIANYRSCSSRPR